MPKACVYIDVSMSFGKEGKGSWVPKVDKYSKGLEYADSFTLDEEFDTVCEFADVFIISCLWLFLRIKILSTGRRNLWSIFLKEMGYKLLCCGTKWRWLMIFTFVKLNFRELPWISSFTYKTRCNSKQQGLTVFDTSFFRRSLKTNLQFFSYSIKIHALHWFHCHLSSLLNSFISGKDSKIVECFPTLKFFQCWS